MLSNKERRRLYDSVGDEAFLEDEASADPEDEHESNFFHHHSFADLFHDFDDSPFMEEPNFHWSFQHDGEDEDGSYEYYSFEDPGFSFYFVDGDESEEEHHY